MKLTQEQRAKLWGETGPYSQVNLIIETRILDDKVSRVFLVVEAEINPFTYQIVKKNRAHFKDDIMIQQLLDNAEYRGLKFGYVTCAFQAQYTDENVMKEAKRRLEETKRTIIKMHKFVMDLINSKEYKFAETIDKKIKDLATKNLQPMGEWEITQVPEPVFHWRRKEGSNPMLNLVVHRESYFIFNAHISLPEEANSAARALLEAIEEHKVIPEILLVREKKIIKELEPIARTFNFVIVYPARLKAVPIVLREMRKTLRRF